MVEKSAKKLEKYIGQLVEFTNGTRGPNAIHTLNLEQVVINVFQKIKSLYPGNNVVLIKRINVPKKLLLDRTRLEIVLSNLMVNSIVHRRLTQTHQWIKVLAFIKGAHLFINIVDNGPGIAPEFQGRVFEMFYRASEDSRGSGLGLYIVKETIAQMGGTINITSESGNGSTFTIKFPLKHVLIPTEARPNVIVPVRDNVLH